MSYADIFKRQTWSVVWILIRRAPRDRRARAALFRFLLVFAGLFAYIVYLVLIARSLLFDLFGALLVGSLLAGAAFFLVVRKWTERYDLIKLGKELPPAVAPDIKDSVFRETCVLAALLERAGSERALDNGLEPGFEVITRRVVLDKLRRHGLLDGLEASYLNLLLAADGSWSEVQKQAVLSGWEFLVVLRWVLGIDSGLRPIWLTPEYHMRMATIVLERTGSADLHMLPPWEMRIERDYARNFFSRCQVELLARGAWPQATPELEEEAKTLKTEIDMAPLRDDFLLGVRTISELELAELWSCTVRSYRRQSILDLLIDVSGASKPGLDFHCFLVDLIAPDKVLSD